MIVFPNCKINLGLQVLHRRGDGFHEIASVFYPVPLTDTLEIITAPQTDQPLLYNYGLPVQGAPEDNLCVKAWQLLKKDLPALPSVAVHLLKNIPMGAGLGGGSADGAFMLQLLNNKFQLQLPEAQLLHYALQLGSDCPFFIGNQPAYATGRGEKLQSINLSLAGYQLLLVQPGIHINTGWAFGQLGLTEGSANTATVQDAITEPVAQWKQLLANDFEKPVFKAYPAIARAKEELYAMGAVYAAMSGSGSTVFGLFNPSFTLPPTLSANYRLIQL